MIAQQVANTALHFVVELRKVLFYERPIARNAQTFLGDSIPQGMKHRKIIVTIGNRAPYGVGFPSRFQMNQFISV